MSDDRGSFPNPGQGRGVKAGLLDQRHPFDLKGRRDPGFQPEGHYCSLDLPSGRDTGIPHRAAPPDAEVLRECRILVVEDDYLLAAGTERALRDAGATVLGPVGQENQALALIAAEAPTCALLDINLGHGTQFSVADALRARAIPFMFVTGYDDVMIPARFRDIGRIRKPMGFRLVLQAAAQMCRSRG